MNTSQTRARTEEAKEMRRDAILEAALSVLASVIKTDAGHQLHADSVALMHITTILRDASCGSGFDRILPTLADQLGAAFSSLYDLEAENRKLLHYPPFARLIRIELRHKNQLFLERQAEAIRNILLPTFDNALLGPEYPHITRLRNEYRQVALLKITRTSNIKKLREILADRIDFYYRNAENKSLRILVDVDPV